MIAAWSFIIAPFQGLEIILRCSPSPLGWAIESRTFGAYLIESRTFGAYLIESRTFGAYLIDSSIDRITVA
jgi:hypothetical protein